MAGRRGYYRYGVTNADGRLRLVRDVAIWPGHDDEFVAISEEPEANGAVMTLERVVNGVLTSIEVSVIDSRPTMLDGSVRYRLRLRLNDGSADSDRAPAARAH